MHLKKNIKIILFNTSKKKLCCNWRFKYDISCLKKIKYLYFVHSLKRTINQEFIMLLNFSIEGNLILKD